MLLTPSQARATVSKQDEQEQDTDGGSRKEGELRWPKPDGGTGSRSDNTSSDAQVSTATKTTRFYGATTPNPIGAKGEFSTIIEEVVQNFTSMYGTNVSIRVEVQAEDTSGFSDQLQRTVRENCRTLGFNNAEFEE